MKKLHTNTIAESTLLLLQKLQSMPLFSQLRLVGGTALALQIGHRNSVDLDLFGATSFSREELEHELGKAGLTVTIRTYKNVVKTTEIANVKVDFVDYSNVKWLEPQIEWDGIRLAGLKDIGAMKISAVTGRGTKKDFIDLFFLLQRFSLEQLIDLYKQKFNTETTFHVIRSLTYFADADDDPHPKMFLPFDWEEAKEKIKMAVAGLV